MTAAEWQMTMVRRGVVRVERAVQSFYDEKKIVHRWVVLYLGLDGREYRCTFEVLASKDGKPPEKSPHIPYSATQQELKKLAKQW